MYKSISIHKFRGIEDLNIDHLAKINLLIGKNGSGKSTVLEALWLHANPTQSLVTRVDLFRAFAWETPAIGRTVPPWRHLFYGYETQDPITISGKANGRSWLLRMRQATRADVSFFMQQSFPSSQGTLPGLVSPGFIETTDRTGESKAKDSLNPLNVSQSGLLVIEFQSENGKQHMVSLVGTGVDLTSISDSTIPTVLAALLTPATRSIGELLVRFGRIDQENKMERVLKFVRILEPGLKRLSAIPLSLGFGGGTNIYVDVGQKELIPVQLMGGGFMSILAFAILTADLEGGLVLIDEIENGVHYSALQALWRGLYELCSETGAQVVATTHSWECIEAARTVLPPEDFLVHRLDRDSTSGHVKVASLDSDMLESATAMGLEVR